MAVTPEQLPPEFATVPEADALLWIEAATGAVDSCAWSCARLDPDAGVKLLAGHYLKASGFGSSTATGASAASESIGGVAVSYALGGDATGPHASTVYGRAYDALQLRVDTAPRCHLPPLPGFP